MFADLRLWALASSLLPSIVLVSILRYDTRLNRHVAREVGSVRALCFAHDRS